LKRGVLMKFRTGWLLAACVALTCGAFGCYPHANKVTLGQSAHEHERQVMRVREHDRRLLVEDLDLLFQADRPTRLTRWHVR